MGADPADAPAPAGHTSTRQAAIRSTAGAIVWPVASLALWNVRGPANFIDRDDGIITLAHARSLARLGTVGVGAFGDRVAGFSSPLHFIVVLPYYLSGADGYGGINRFLGFISIALIGALTLATIHSELRTYARPYRFAAMTIAAAIQFTCWGFYSWQFSGMENPLTASLLLAIVWLTPSAYRTSRSALLCGTLLGLLAIARFDAISLALPLVLVLTWQNRSLTKTSTFLLRSSLIASPVFLFPVVTLACCKLYFGQFGPTTVQNRTKGLGEVATLSGVAGLLFLGTLGVVVALAPPRCLTEDAPLPTAGRIPRPLMAGAGCLLLGVSIVLAGLNGDAFDLMSIKQAVLATGVTWAGILVLAAWLLPPLRPPRLLTYSVVLAWVPLYEMVFGPTRISSERVVSVAVPVISVAAAIISTRGLVFLHVTWREGASRARVAAPQIAAVCVVLIVALLSAIAPPQAQRFSRTTYQGWIISPRDQIVVHAAQATVSEVDERIIPIVASADLGKLSFRNEVQIVDLGLIGDPVYLATTRESDPGLRVSMMSAYLFDVMPPDALLLNSDWSCALAPVLTDPLFIDRYERIDVGSGSAPNDGDVRDPAECEDGVSLENGLWRLRDPGARDDLTEAHRLLDGWAVDASFFEPCQSERTADCFARVRAYRRVFPGPAGADAAEPWLRGLGATAQGRLAKALIASPVDRNWSDDAIAALEDIARQHQGSP